MYIDEPNGEPHWSFIKTFKLELNQIIAERKLEQNQIIADSPNPNSN